MTNLHRLAAVALLALGAAAADSQPARVRRPGGLQRPSASDLIALRRALDLTPRQMARLDSIERAQYSARRQIAERVRGRRDSLCADRDPCNLSTGERAAFRDWVDSQLPSRTQALRNDSIARSRVMGVLDSTQTARLRELRSARGRDQVWPGPAARGFAAQRMRFMGRGGLAAGRGFGPGMGGRRGALGQGFPRGVRPQGFGPRIPRMMRPRMMGPGTMGPMGGAGMRRFQGWFPDDDPTFGPDQPPPVGPRARGAPGAGPRPRRPAPPDTL